MAQRLVHILHGCLVVAREKCGVRGIQRVARFGVRRWAGLLIRIFRHQARLGCHALTGVGVGIDLLQRLGVIQIRDVGVARNVVRVVIAVVARSIR